MGWGGSEKFQPARQRPVVLPRCAPCRTQPRGPSEPSRGPLPSPLQAGSGRRRRGEIPAPSPQTPKLLRAITTAAALPLARAPPPRRAPRGAPAGARRAEGAAGRPAQLPRAGHQHGPRAGAAHTHSDPRTQRSRLAAHSCTPPPPSPELAESLRRASDRRAPPTRARVGGAARRAGPTAARLPAPAGAAGGRRGGAGLGRGGDGCHQ